MPTKLLYEPDNSCGRTTNKSSELQCLLTGKSVQGLKSVSSTYKTATTTQKSSKRLDVQPDISKTLTPKGYTKMQLMLGVAQKRYDNTVKSLKGTGKLFEDPNFPADSKAIGNIPNLPQITWLRPKEIDPKAEFIVGGFDRTDVSQGMLGDCWLLAVMSSMADIKPLFEHCVPPGQLIQSKDYVGLFKFRFWQFGNWVEVLIDDRLPVDARTKKLIFMHSDESNEMWSALMEKAYAKLNGSYANLSGGTQAEAMEDMTGGLTETIDLTKIDLQLLTKDLIKYEKRCCLMGCSVTSKIIEEKLTNGLIAGHAYSVTGVFSLNVLKRKQVLVRCRNPWGNNYEWSGAWADNSKEWKSISAEQKKELDISFSGDGEFWMSIEDFKSNFTKLEVCHLGHSSLEADMAVRGKRRLEEALFTGEWKLDISAGGCPNYRESFWTNPQFRFTAIDSDPSDDDILSTITIGLMQIGGRKLRGANFLTIGFAIYPVSNEVTGIMKRSFFTTTAPIKVSQFSNSREIVLRIKVEPGAYMVVPCTFKPNEESKFILRIFSELPIKEAEFDDKNSLLTLSEEDKQEIAKEQGIKNEDTAMDDLFNKEMDPKSKSINATKLRKILNASSMKNLCSDSKGFSLESVRSMLAAMDDNQTGRMEYPEFKMLWEKFQSWKAIFTMKDKDKSKSLNAIEMRESLETAGFKVNSKVYTACINRFVNRELHSVAFEDWLLLCTRLFNAFENMQAQSKTSDGLIQISLEDYIRSTIYQ